MSSRPAQMVNESRFGDCVLTIETTMGRYKVIIGRRLRARTLPSQKIEARAVCFAQPDDPARQAGVSAHRLKGSYSCRSTSVSRFVHQSRCADLRRLPLDVLAKVGVEGSNPFARSSRFPSKASPPNFEPVKRPGSGQFCGLGLGFLLRNDTRNLSPNGPLSPDLGGWPIYSTSFFLSIFNEFQFTSG
jgi:hypothetical protein